MKEYRELENKKDIPALNRDIEEDIEEDDEEIELLEKLLAQKRARKKRIKILRCDKKVEQFCSTFL